MREVVNGSCPSGGYSLNNDDGYCYKYYKDEGAKNFWDAWDRCDQDGTHLPMVTHSGTWTKLRSILCKAQQFK